MKKILILSVDYDEHLPFVTKYLDKREILCYDPFETVNGRTIDYSFHNENFDILYNDHPLNAIESIWLRRPTTITEEAIPVKKKNRQYAKSALNKHAQMLTYAFPNALWVSHPDAIKKAAVKLVQFRVAAKLGFRIPKTLFASSGNQAREFISKHKICIAKSMAVYFPKDYSLFTRIIHKEDNLNFANLHYDPFIFQEYIEPAAEFRVTVVKDKVFVSEVSGKETDGIKSYFRDWRFAHLNDSFISKETGLSTTDTKRCASLVKELGLIFGAIDLIKDKKGNIWFLEINANGQWAFQEDIVNQKIGMAIADLLMRK